MEGPVKAHASSGALTPTRCYFPAVCLTAHDRTRRGRVLTGKADKAASTDLFGQARRHVRQQWAGVEVGQESLVQVLRSVFRSGVHQLPVRQRPERRVTDAMARYVAQQ